MVPHPPTLGAPWGPAGSRTDRIGESSRVALHSAPRWQRARLSAGAEALGAWQMSGEGWRCGGLMFMEVRVNGEGRGLVKVMINDGE